MLLKDNINEHEHYNIFVFSPGFQTTKGLNLHNRVNKKN